MKKSILCFMGLLFTILSSSWGNNKDETPFKKNTGYLELGGNGLLTSINYERQLFNKPGLGFHVGMGIYGFKEPHLTIPFGFNYLINLKNNQSFLDFGLGMVYTKAEVLLYVTVKRPQGYVHTDFWSYIPSIGYRRHTKSNYMIRVAVTPVINNIGLLPFFGFSIGKGF